MRCNYTRGVRKEEETLSFFHISSGNLEPAEKCDELNATNENLRRRRERERAVNKYAAEFKACFKGRE